MEDANELLKLDDEDDLGSEDELYGDFEDLETGETFESEKTRTFANGTIRICKNKSYSARHVSKNTNSCCFQKNQNVN